LVTADDSLCRLHFCSEAEWTNLPDDRRAATSVHVPGLGWVIAEPIRKLDGLDPAPPGPDRRRADRREVATECEIDRRGTERRGPDRREWDREEATETA
jgi:hypothetical protein